MGNLDVRWEVLRDIGRTTQTPNRTQDKFQRVETRVYLTGFYGTKKEPHRPRYTGCGVVYPETYEEKSNNVSECKGLQAHNPEDAYPQRIRGEGIAEFRSARRM